MRSRQPPEFLRSCEAAIRWAKKNGPEADDEWYEQEIEERACDYSDFAESAFNHDKIVLYRAIALPSIDFIEWDRLGKAWSRYRSGASPQGTIPYKRHETSIFVLEGLVDPADVDWEWGFYSFLVYGEDQWEVAIKNRSQVEIVSVNGDKVHVIGNTGIQKYDEWIR
jgi:hypothetical protein